MNKIAKIEQGGLASALVVAQSNMGKALKQANNPHFRSKYADLASVVDACVPALNDAGIAVVQPTGEDDAGRFVETCLIHAESGESLSCKVPLIVAKNDMQGYGSAVTYARRYGLMSMAGIAPEDDDGNAAAKSPPKKEDATRSGPSKEAVEAATSSLGNAENVNQLRAIWSDLPNQVQNVAAVIEAKDKRKAVLDQPDETETENLTDEIDDEIPHQ